MLLLSSNIKRLIPAVGFTVLAFGILLEYQDMLFTAHLRTPFMCGAEFWNELKSEPFAMMRWIGCWFTQMAYYPMLATILYLVIWGVSYFFLEKTLNIQNKLSSLVILPFACMLLGLTSVGYWIYVQKDWGFWFSHPFAFLVALIILWGTNNKFKDKTILPIAIVYLAIFPIIGWYSIMMAVCQMILQCKDFRWKVCPLIIPVLSPVIWHLCCFNGVSTTTMWLGGFPIFVDAQEYAIRPMAPFIAMAIFMIILCLVAVLQKDSIDSTKSNTTTKKDNLQYLLITSTVLIVSFIGVKLFAFSDYNYQAEMRMNKYAMEEDWKSVIKEAQKADSLSRSMVLLNNIALLNTEQLGNRAFKIGNDGKEIYNPDGIQLSAMHIASPTVYYNYGKLNYTIRWSVEFAVGYGYSPYFLMYMIRAAKGAGEEKLAQRYLTLLHGHLFYKNWKPKATSPIVKSLAKTYGNSLDSDHNNMERYLIETFSNSYVTNNKTVSELCLFNSMLYHSPEIFWNAFVTYMQGHLDQPLPVHYQEAYCSFMNIYPVQLTFKVNINPQIQSSFQTFIKQYNTKLQAGLEAKEIGEEMKDKWGGTYWWHLVFGRNAY